MIKNIWLLHYLSESTYKSICRTLGLDESNQKTKTNFILAPDDPIYRIELFNIVYKAFGHIWFLHTSVNFVDFNCPNEAFGHELFVTYGMIFGEEAMGDFPVFEHINCNHIDFYNVFKVAKADDVVERMRSQGCPPIPSDLTDDGFAKEPRGKIMLCVSKKDDTHIETLTCCHGGVLKRHIKDTSFHVGTGVSAAKMLEAQTEKEIMDWVLKKYTIDVLPETDTFDNRVGVIGADGQAKNDTYLRRAKGLVKNGRAEWLNERTIKMIDSINEVN